MRVHERKKQKRTNAREKIQKIIISIDRSIDFYFLRRRAA